MTSPATRTNGHSQNAAPVTTTPAPTRVIRQAKGTRQLDASKVYTLSAFSRELGAGRWAVKEMRRAGLICRRFGGRTYIISRDFVRFLEEQASGDG
jgi:hypothetical protein